MINRAKELRHEATDVERRLWNHLRSRQFEGFKFRRQRPIGPYIVDFVCLESELVIELDGGQHADQADYDARRDAYLRQKGYRVIRFWNNDVIENIEGVAHVIETALREGPHPNPLPQAGEGAHRARGKQRRMEAYRARASG